MSDSSSSDDEDPAPNRGAGKSNLKQLSIQPTSTTSVWGRNPRPVSSKAVDRTKPTATATNDADPPQEHSAIEKGASLDSGVKSTVNFAMETSSSREYVPEEDAFSEPAEVQAAHNASTRSTSDVVLASEAEKQRDDLGVDSDPEFGRTICAKTLCTTTTEPGCAKRKVDDMEARSSVETPPSTPAIEGDVNEDKPATKSTRTSGSGSGKSRANPTTDDCVDPEIHNCKMVMRGSKKAGSKDKSWLGFDFQAHVKKTGIEFVHAVLAVPSGFPTDVPIHATAANDGSVQLFKPLDIKDAHTFFDASLKDERKFIDEFIDTSPENALWVATACVVVGKAIPDASPPKFAVCAMLRVRLSDEVDQCSTELLDQWAAFKSKVPTVTDGNNDVVFSLQKETVQKLLKTTASRKHVCASLAKCFVTPTNKRKQNQVPEYVYQVLDDNCTLQHVVGTERKPAASSSGATASSRRPRSGKQTTVANERDTVQDSSSANTNTAVEASDKAPVVQSSASSSPSSSTTALVVHSDGASSAPTAEATYDDVDPSHKVKRMRVIKVDNGIKTQAYVQGNEVHIVELY